MNRKGFINDAYLWIVLIFVAGLAIPIGYYFLAEMDTAVNASPAGSVSGGFITQFTEDFRNSWDWAFLTIIISSWVGLLILSWVLRGNPALFFGLVFIILLIGLFAGFLSNAYEDVTTTGALSTTPSNFPVLNFLMSNLLTTSLIMIFSMSIVFFAKPGGDTF